MDPVLRLYPGCDMMMCDNQDVGSGKANGTTCTAEGLQLINGEEPIWVPMTIRKTVVWVRAVYATQVDHIKLKHSNDKINPPLFNLEPKIHTIHAEMPHPKFMGATLPGTNKIKLKATQIPLVSNTATTGHKLQGASLESLFVHDWCYYNKNWPYVILSRVKTMKGLKFRRPLRCDLTNLKAFEQPTDYKEFINRMKVHLPDFYTDDMDDELLQAHFEY